MQKKWFCIKQFFLWYLKKTKNKWTYKKPQTIDIQLPVVKCEVKQRKEASFIWKMIMQLFSGLEWFVVRRMYCMERI